MNRSAAIVLMLMLVGACEKPSPPPASSASVDAPKVRGPLKQLLGSNATVIGYLYTPDKPYIIAAFSHGTLIWKSDPERPATTQGEVQVFNEPDRTCLGFERRNLLMPNNGPERYLVCEALQAIEHSNSLPRSQDFSLRPGTMFIEYRPPAGTGFPQLFNASVKQ